MNTGSPSGGMPGAGQEDPAGEATVLRMLLGARLRRLREAAGVSAEKAGYEIRASRSKISRIETGRVGLKVRDIEDLLTIYGVADEGERAKALALARRSRKPEWWTRYNDNLPDVVYTEQLASAVYLDQRPDVEHYLEVADQLSGEALSPVDTMRFLDQVADET